jgi:ubiquinone/menaquinone biosynthesis C-methylase UbiE
MDVMGRSGPLGLPSTIVDHYEGRPIEQTGRRRGAGRLEILRTREVVRRYLDRSGGMHVLEVGGAAGAHAPWLAEDGHDVVMIGPSALQIEEARSHSQSNERTFRVELGDARELRVEDDSFDAVVLSGPMYHFVRRGARVDALHEAQRVVRPGGFVFAAAISRFSSFFDGTQCGYLSEPGYRSIVDGHLLDPPASEAGRPRDWFTSVYFHSADDLEREAHDAGLRTRQIVGLPTISGWLSRADLFDIDRPVGPDAALLDVARDASVSSTVVEPNEHLLLVAQRPL